jgi:hypothetical protein
MSDTDTRFLSANLAKVAAVCAVLYVLITGLSDFLAALGEAPTREIGRLAGALVWPIVPGYFSARFLSKRRGVGFLKAWMVVAVIIVAIVAIRRA